MRISFSIVSVVTLCVSVNAWSVPKAPVTQKPSSKGMGNRRQFLASTLAVGATTVAGDKTNADTGTEVRGIELNAFNGLIFQYRGGEYEGLSAADVDEPSISYADFMGKLKEGKVDYVEFLAPYGDKAYATIAGEKPIRIGEGYPIEQHDGYSSPVFCIRAVKNAGVPYTFTVPALAAYNKQ